MPSEREKMISELKKIVVPELRDRGFKGHSLISEELLRTK